MSKIKNVLAVGAHPDDIEIMCGGALLNWLSKGVNVHVVIFTKGGWKSPDGIEVRSSKDAISENRKVVEYMKYTSIKHLNYTALTLNFSDNLVVEVLQQISKHNIDTIIYPWIKDTHHDHEVVSRVVSAASRRVPNLLMGQINYYMNEFFSPNIFIDITNEWEKKIEALQLFSSQWARSGNDWTEYLDVTSRYYGKIIGVKRAEGFIANRIQI
jgi:N-acetylglucosamine malate deacetylase 1